MPYPTETERRVALVVNAHAKTGHKAFEAAKNAFAARGMTVDGHAVENPRDLDRTIAEVLAKGHRFVVLGGGDGTVSSSVKAFANTDVVLGVIPLGTANSFARSLGVPLDVEGAVGVAMDGVEDTVDLGRVGDRFFTNVVSIGLQTAIARSVSPGVKRVLGRGAYLVAAARQLGRFKSFRTRLTLNEQDAHDFADVLEVRIANGPFKGGVLMTPEADLASGDLVAHVVKGRSTVTLARTWARLALGERPGPDTLESLRAPVIALSTTPALDVSVDGELFGQTPITLSLAPRALRVMRAREMPNR